MSKHRLELFSDAVMAIILTIMVLDLKSPAEGGWHAWLAVLPSIAVYLLGFLLVTAIWVVHRHYLLRFKVINAQILWANSALLFALSLVPLVVRAVADHPHDTADTLAFLVIFGCLMLCTTWIRVAAKKDHEHDPEFLHWYKTRSKHAIAMLSLLVLQIAVAFVSPVSAQLLAGAITLGAMFSVIRTEREHEAPASANKQPANAATAPLSLQ